MEDVAMTTRYACPGALDLLLRRILEMWEILGRIFNDKAEDPNAPSIWEQTQWSMLQLQEDMEYDGTVEHAAQLIADSIRPRRTPWAAIRLNDVVEAILDVTDDPHRALRNELPSPEGLLDAIRDRLDAKAKPVIVSCWVTDDMSKPGMIRGFRIDRCDPSPFGICSIVVGVEETDPLVPFLGRCGTKVNICVKGKVTGDEVAKEFWLFAVSCG
ncbi:MAG: hypothetical protein MUP47_07630 [Phycisphaerae bacterium]|nr:hypothetical protein [Phycisphaerae bacterium]